MKKLIASLLIVMFMLTGCGYLGGEMDDDNNQQAGTSGNNTNDVVGDEVNKENTPSDKTENNDNTQTGENNNDSQGGENNGTQDGGSGDEIQDGSGSESTVQSVTLNDYIQDLIGGEYCSDADFLNFVATMDERAVGNIIYASPNGEGEGDMNDPASIYDAIDMAKPGDTVYLRGGEYILTEAIWLSNSGKAGAYITIKSYPGENAVITTTPENINKYNDGGEYLFFAFDEGTSYIIFEDIEIRSATYKYVGAFVCYDGGQNHLIFKNIKIHDLHTTKTTYDANAFLFMGEKKNPINNIMLIGNECYDLTLGYSEAVSFAGNCEYCYVIGNEVYNCSNIGIDFYGNAEYCSVESLDQTRYCVAAYNTVYNCNSPYADCAGIYVDGGRNCLIEGNYVYSCQYGIEIGSEELKEKYPVIDIIVRNNVLKDNSICAMRIGGYDTKTSGTVYNCYVYNNSFIDNDGSNIILSKVDNVVFANNIFIGNEIYIETEFDVSYIKNLKFYNNSFSKSGKTFEIYGDDIDINEINSRYGGNNVVSGLTLDGDFYPSEILATSKDYSSKYDFYLCVREEDVIGAVYKKVN